MSGFFVFLIVVIFLFLAISFGFKKPPVWIFITGVLLWWAGVPIDKATLWLLAMIGALLPILLVLSAYNSWQATFVKEGTIRAVVQGESFLKMLSNVPDKTTDSQGKLVDLKERETRPRGILGSGIYWVSVFYPYRRVHSFKILKSRLLTENERGGKAITEWITQEPGAEVSELLWKFPIPFLIENVDLQQGFRVTFVVYVLFEVIDPYTAIFIWNGKFAQQMATAVEGAVYNFGRGLTYHGLLQEEVGKGNRNFTPNFLMPLNKRVRIIEGGKVINEEVGVVEQFGIEISGGWIVGFDPSERDQELLRAVQEEEKQTRLARAAEAKAHGKANAIRIVAEAEGDRNRRNIGSMTGVGVNPNIAAGTFKDNVRSDAVRDSNLSTWVEGGGSAVVSIPSGDSRKPKDSDSEKKDGDE
jgi:hypothetical protein